MRAQMVLSDILSKSACVRSGTRYSMPCPLCNHAKANMAIWVTSEHKIAVKCFYSVGGACHPHALVYYFQSLGIDIDIEDLDTSPRQHSTTWPEIWNAATAVFNSHADDYLLARGIDIRLSKHKIDSLGCLVRLKHMSGTRYPVLLGLIQHAFTNEHLGLHRTYLSLDGKSKAPVIPNKMTLGRIDEGAVKLFEPRDNTIGIAEGIETALSAAALLDWLPTWAAVTAGNMETLVFPPTIHRVIILADNDTPGAEGAKRAKIAYEKQKLSVEIYTPDAQYKDFNDLAVGKKIGAE